MTGNLNKSVATHWRLMLATVTVALAPPWYCASASASDTECSSAVSNSGLTLRAGLGRGDGYCGFDLENFQVDRSREYSALSLK
jgi:hypothetical protein